MTAFTEPLYDNRHRHRDDSNGLMKRIIAYGQAFPSHLFISLLFVVALGAFEIFNFDTTKFALGNLLGEISFAGVSWAAVLAVAFCSIDFAGLVRLFTPEEDAGEAEKENWFMMGAWLLGAMMNAAMTWWAVSLTILNHPLIGNEILSRDQLLTIVPVFVAVLVLLTRILFIGAFTIAGERLAKFSRRQANATSYQQPQAQTQPRQNARRNKPVVVEAETDGDELPDFMQNGKAKTRKAKAITDPKSSPDFIAKNRTNATKQRTEVRRSTVNANRVNKRPPMRGGGIRPTAPMAAKGKYQS